LFSRGLANSFQTVNSLAWRLIEAAHEKDWSTQRFVGMDAIQQSMFDMHDDLAYSSYVAFRDYALWNVMIRVWDTFNFYTEAALTHTLSRYQSSRDDQLFRSHERAESELAAMMRELLTTARTTCEAGRRCGGADTPTGAGEILARLHAAGKTGHPIFLHQSNPRDSIHVLDPHRSSGAHQKVFCVNFRVTGDIGIGADYRRTGRTRSQWLPRRPRYLWQLSIVL
jgi:tetracycline 7-halogenase / FADH2 O2-dependent halogenase